MPVPHPRQPETEPTGVRLPRSVMAALWLPYVTDLGSAEHASRAITGDDEPHCLVLGRSQLNWPALFARWAPARAVGAAMPVPGDPAGAPAVVAAEAISAGECLVVVAREGSWAAVPEVSTFGSALEPGATVTWRVTEVPDAGSGLTAAAGSLAEARARLAEALVTATDALTAADVARWRPDAAERIGALASTSDPGWPLPAALDAGRAQVLERAARLLAIVALAEDDEGAAVTGSAADHRRAALRGVAQAARRAMSAATVTHRR